ncbi:hypothetical protein WG922_00995 [Ramlibacter sp. AN1015]|uniref:hypothetical protein n=1 Tax=Ramlibacter sp. AN1015 TaxID=3133428 RepID=UPI0030BF0E3C
MPGDKKSGEVHLPEVERDLPLQGGSEDGAQARHQEGGREQGVRKAGIVREDDAGDEEGDGDGSSDAPAAGR